MPKSKREKRQLIVFIICGILLAFLIFVLFAWKAQYRPKKTPEPVWGATFSKSYAEALELDWKTAYIAALDDLKIRLFRIPVYWNDIEPTSKNYRFDDYDWMLDEAQKRGAKILLAVGRKLPRWPECHIPEWAKKISPDEQELKLLGSLQATVKHFRSSPAIYAWQVENEALFKFGVCPPHGAELLKKEVDIVHGLDNRPVVITDSGELSSWIRAAEIADILGISMYRATWDKIFGYFYFPIPPAYYRKKAETVSPRYAQKVIVTELQAEPWGRLPNNKLPLEEQYQSMNLARFKRNIDFARRTGLSEIYLWGVEWWYWLKEKQGNAEFWEEAKRLFEK